MKEYDIIVIGGGPGGYQTAVELGKAGMRTLLVEREKERIGGVCLNEGCIPTKNYLESAAFVSKASYFQECAITVGNLNLKQLSEKTIALKNELRSGVLWILEQANVEILYASASFIDANTIEALGEKILFKKCVIATGSQSREVPELPIDGSRILTSSHVFELKSMPKSITIVGVGAIGCEFATFFNAFGTDVTLIGRSSQLLPHEDEDISKALQRAFKQKNIRVMTSTIIEKVNIMEDGVELFLQDNEKIRCEVVLSATGRIPYTQGLSLEKAGVKQDSKGFIEINPSFVTSTDNIYAVGDCIATPAYAHTAYAEAKIVALNIINSQDNANIHISPSAVFSTPAVASCGLKEKEAKEMGIEVEVKKALFKVNAREKIHGDDSGFANIIVSAESGVLLGASILGIEATEIIHELLLAIEKKVTLKELKRLIHTHPTVSEIISYL